MSRLCVLALFLLVVDAPVGAAVPAGFDDELVAMLPGPTGLAFTPDGRMLVTTQTGKLWVVRPATTPVTALDLASILCTNSERGLLGVAVDPAFASNRYIYLFYTYNKSGVCDRNTSSAPVNRVSRFTLSDSNTVARSSELLLIDNIPSPNGNHNGGDLHFGRDGFLYVSVGDGGCDYRGDSGCGGANDAARDAHVLLGKILRVTSTGGIPSSNPFQDSTSVRCNVTGRGSPGQKCRETFASGLRNPFRIAFDRNATGTRFFINDVGQNVWEEINDGIAGADYGWNEREGRCTNGSTTDCGPGPAGLTNPLYAYGHADGCASITGGAFVPRGLWPAPYDGAYLFSDYVCGSIFRLTRASDGTYGRASFVTGLGGSSAVAMVFGPWENTQALYYTTYADGGQVRRIAYTTNRAPVARAAASPTSGPAPLTVTLDAGASSDPDGDSLTFAWTPGDGAASIPGAQVTHTYSTVGRYTATVRVQDGLGGGSTASILIDVGNTPPVASMASPATNATFAVGQTLTLTGSAVDREQGTLGGSQLTWTVLLHHNTHTHPYVGPVPGNNITFRAPAPEDLAATATSFLEVRLTATDAQGASSTVTRNVQPRRVSVTFGASPTGLAVQVNGSRFTTPRTITSWENYRLRVVAASQRDATGQPWLFSSWSDGGAAEHEIVTPSSPGTYTATFSRAVAFAATADTYVRGGAYAGHNFGTATTMNVKTSATADTNRRGFVRFTTGTGSVGRAVLRLRAALSSAGTVAVAARPVASTSWSETAMTWNTQPSYGAMLSTVSIAGTTGAWYEWDVTAHVRAERAAGRTSVAFALVAPSATSPYVQFDAREGTAGDPELLIGDAAATPAAGEIVRHAPDASVVAGSWRRVSDSSAAGGVRLHHPDAGAGKLATALAVPTNYVEFTFDATAGRAYRLWIRGRADRNAYVNDSVFVQFSGAVTSAGAAAYRIGTTASTTYVLEECGGCAISGWGWEDNGYGSGVLGPLIYFAQTGRQTLRIQTREDGLSIDQVVVSPGTYLSRAPGAVRNDATIVPR